MCSDKDLTPSERDELTAAVNRLQMQVVRQMETILDLQKELAEAQRTGKRQAAPFSKGRRTTETRRPGRKPGTGSFSFRKPPLRTN